MSLKFNWQDTINEEELNKVAEILKNDGIIVFPTETVYGIGANALSEKAVDKIYEAKGRENDNPLIVHISNLDMLKNLIETPNEIEQKLIDSFFPGPFTLILKKKNVLPNNVTANLDTAGIRMPENRIAREIIERVGFPIAAPSANISGRPSGTTIEDIIEELDGKVDVIIDGGKSKIGLESTVVKVIEGIPTILRPGKITLEDIDNARLDKAVFEKAEGKVESPGMKYKHYAPKTKCVLIEDIERVKEIKEKNKCIIGFDEDEIADISLGSINNLEEVSSNIYTALRKADKLNVDLIVIHGVKKEGLGIAIMNRLIRATNYNMI